MTVKTASLVLAFLRYNLKSIIIIIILFLLLLLFITFIITLPLITMTLRLLSYFLVHLESFHLLIHALQSVILLCDSFLKLSIESQKSSSHGSNAIRVIFHKTELI